MTLRGHAAILAAFTAMPGCAGAADVSDAEVMAIVRRHCIVCHATAPTHESFPSAPAGLVLETIEAVRQNKQKILEQAVEMQAMPLGNQSGMTEAERVMLGDWIAKQK